MDSIDRPTVAKAPASATVTRKQLDEVFGHIKHYFGDHPTIAEQSEKDAVRLMSNACKDLAKRALDLGDLNYANHFLWWMIQRRNAECVRLMDKVVKLGGSFGLPKTIVDLWDEFVSECDDEIEEESASDEPEYVEQDSAHNEEKAELAAEPETPNFDYQRKMLVTALQAETDLLRRPMDRVTVDLNPLRSQVGVWLKNVSYDGHITHERVSRSLLRVAIAWNVARYITEHADQFIVDGDIDSNYTPVIDPEVQAEMDAEKKAAEEQARELARKQREEAEAAEIQRKKDEEEAEAQRKAEEEAAEVAHKLRLKRWNCRLNLIENTDVGSGIYCYFGKFPIVVLREYLTETFPGSFKITKESERFLEAEVSGSLLDALRDDPINFRENGLTPVGEQELAMA